MRLAGAGRARNFTIVAALIDTNILVYRFDPRFPAKQQAAQDLLRKGIAEGNLRVPHQAIIEFVAAVTRPLGRRGALLSPAEAYLEAEDLLNQFEILYPNESLVRLAIRGAATYRMPWFDAHLWAYAEYFGMDELISEDFQHDRLYGRVRAVNPFL
jgi:predicted nucleic acid-binding protein